MVPWCHGVIARDPRPPTALLEFSFRQEGGGGLPLGPPPSLPWTPSPPSPLCSNSPENQGSGNVFAFGPFFSSRAFGAPIARFFGHSILSFLPSVANTMSQRPISAFFSTPVQPCPGAKRDDVVNAILYFRFQDRWTGKKRQEAYNVAQKACSNSNSRVQGAHCRCTGATHVAHRRRHRVTLHTGTRGAQDARCRHTRGKQGPHRVLTSMD